MTRKKRKGIPVQFFVGFFLILLVLYFYLLYVNTGGFPRQLYNKKNMDKIVFDYGYGRKVTIEQRLEIDTIMSILMTSKDLKLGSMRYSGRHYRIYFYDKNKDSYECMTTNDNTYGKIIDVRNSTYANARFYDLVDSLRRTNGISDAPR